MTSDYFHASLETLADFLFTAGFLEFFIHTNTQIQNRRPVTGKLIIIGHADRQRLSVSR